MLRGVWTSEFRIIFNHSNLQPPRQNVAMFEVRFVCKEAETGEREGWRYATGCGGLCVMEDGIIEMPW